MDGSQTIFAILLMASDFREFISQDPEDVNYPDYQDNYRENLETELDNGMLEEKDFVLLNKMTKQELGNAKLSM